MISSDKFIENYQEHKHSNAEGKNEPHHIIGAVHCGKEDKLIEGKDTQHYSIQKGIDEMKNKCSLFAGLKFYHD